MEKDDEKVRRVILSQHQSIRFACERVSPLFCSFEKKKFTKKYHFGIERLQFKSKFLVTVKYTSTLKRYSKWGMSAAIKYIHVVTEIIRLDLGAYSQTEFHLAPPYIRNLYECTPWLRRAPERWNLTWN